MTIRKKQELLYHMRAIMIGTMMLISGVVFLCYMGSSLIRFTKKYQKQTMQVAQKLPWSDMEE